MTYTFLEDIAIADAAFDVEAENLRELFIDAAKATFETMVKLSDVETKESREFSLEEEDVDKLYKYWKFPKQDKLLMDFVIHNRNIEIDLDMAKKLHVHYKIDKRHIMKLLEYQGKHDIHRELKTWKVPVFPVNGNLCINSFSSEFDVTNLVHNFCFFSSFLCDLVIINCQLIR